MPNVCSAKREWVENGIENHEAPYGNKEKEGFKLGEAHMWHVKLPFSKYGSLLRGEF